MRVEWDMKAVEGRDRIADYIKESFGYKRKDIFLQEVRQTTRMLKKYPNMGFIDPLFVEYQHTYRSIVIGGLSKMVYFVENDSIYIAAFWDCRQEPETQTSEMEK